jgi:hypothetical protein
MLTLPNIMLLTETDTFYALSRVLNNNLALLGLKAVPSQMMYNYKRNRLIPATADGLVTADAGNAWMAKYLTKRIAA